MRNEKEEKTRGLKSFTDKCLYTYRTAADFTPHAGTSKLSVCCVYSIGNKVCYGCV